MKYKLNRRRRIGDSNFYVSSEGLFWTRAPKTPVTGITQRGKTKPFFTCN